MEWKEVRLGDVCTKITDGSHFSPKAQTEGYPMLSVKDMREYDFDFSNCKKISYEDFLKMEKDGCVPQIGDVLVAKDGSYLKEIFICKEQREIALLSSIAIFRPNPQLIDPRFLCYCLKSPRVFNYISLNCVSGSALPRIILKDFKGVNIKVPSLADQRRIASILSSLDRKIELNNKINADLEEMAQAIFKNWFVDFEPFKDGKFVNSELGMIPEGWKVGSYSEMIESLISGDWGKENPQGNYTHEVACVRGCDFQDINNGVRGKTPQRYILEKNYQAKHLKDKDILVEISGGTATVSTGRTSLVTEELLKKYKHDIVCTNFCKVLRPLSQFSSYVYYSWKYKYDNDIMFGYENGTSGIKNFAIKDFIEKEPVLIPNEQDIVEFQSIIDKLQKQKQINGSENSRLSLLRDTLLPRLMSGEIEVPE